MSWSSATDTQTEFSSTDGDEQPPAASSFKFDLGSALDRIGAANGDEPSPSAPAAPPDPASAADPSPDPPLPVADAELPVRRPATGPSEPLPRRTSARPVDPPTSSVVSSASPARPAMPGHANARAGGSVFDGAAPAPTLAAAPAPTRSIEPSAPVIPPETLNALPTLPAPTAAAPPAAAASASAPAEPDIHAVRSYQLRAHRERSRSKVVGRTLLVVVILGGLVGAALVFGRSFLFPQTWDPELTPLVDDVQRANGGEFTEAVAYEVLDDADYAVRALEVIVGPEWSDRMPEWRALGLATGAGDADAVVDAVLAYRPVVYDPANATIYRAAGPNAGALDADLRFTLDELYARQHADAADPTPEPDSDPMSNDDTANDTANDDTANDDTANDDTANDDTANDDTAGDDDAAADTAAAADDADDAADDAADDVAEAAATETAADELADAGEDRAGVLGVSSLPAINSRAIDRALIGVPADATTQPPDAPTPLPILYELAAVDVLGEPLVAAAGAGATTWSYGDDYPAASLRSTSVPSSAATPPPVPAGTEPMADPVALGTDDWTLIWRNRLPQRAVDRLNQLVISDSYRTVRAAGMHCFAATFQTASETDADEVLVALGRWTLAAPESSAAAATLAAPARVALNACDPGPGVDQSVNPDAVVAVLGDQVERINRGSS